MSKLRLAPIIGGLLATATALAGCTDSRPTAQNGVEKIKERGYLSCSSSQGVPGLSRPDEKGVWRGFDSDICRAITTAILGDAEKVRFVPLNSAQRLPALQTGEIDVLSRTTTITFKRDMAVRFAAVTQYDRDAILIRKALGVTKLTDLDGMTVCMQGGGSLVEGTLDEVEEDWKIKFKRVYFDSTITARDTYLAGRCDMYVTDGLAAQGQLHGVVKNPDEHQFMYVTDFVEPNAVAVPRGDDRMFDVVRWTVNVLIWAEENGITQANVDEKLRTGNAMTKRVLGSDDVFSKAIGLDQRWAYNVIKQVGNFGEIWDRNLGSGSAIKADRAMNKLRSEEGGLMYSYPWD